MLVLYSFLNRIRTKDTRKKRIIIHAIWRGSEVPLTILDTPFSRAIFKTNKIIYFDEFKYKIVCILMCAVCVVYSVHIWVPNISQMRNVQTTWFLIKIPFWSICKMQKKNQNEKGNHLPCS